MHCLTAPDPLQESAQSNVYSLHEHRNADVIAAAEALLAEARSGRLTAFAYVAQVNGHNAPLSLTGSYVRDPFARQDLVVSLYDFVRERIRP